METEQSGGYMPIDRVIDNNGYTHRLQMPVSLRQTAGTGNSVKYMSASGTGAIMLVPTQTESMTDCITTGSPGYCYDIEGDDAVYCVASTLETVCFTVNLVGGNGGYPPTPPQGEDAPATDPCTEAKKMAEKAKDVANSDKFKEAYKDIKAAEQADGKEHCVTLGKDANGNTNLSNTTNGEGNSGTSENIPGAYADLHNHHPGIRADGAYNVPPPSAGDLYSLGTREW